MKKNNGKQLLDKITVDNYFKIDHQALEFIKDDFDALRKAFIQNQENTENNKLISREYKGITNYLTVDTAMQLDHILGHITYLISQGKNLQIPLSRAVSNDDDVLLALNDFVLSILEKSLTKSYQTEIEQSDFLSNIINRYIIN